MIYTILEDLVFYQVLSFVNKYSNYELKLREFFFKKTKIYPKCVIIINQFIFFVIENDLITYNKVKKHLLDLRRNLRKKIIIVREQSTLINLVYSFFPDVFIYNIEIEEANSLGKRSLLISFLTFRDRCIAIGRNGEYIKAINQLLENYIKFQNNNSKIKIKCKVADHYELYKNLNINISI